MSRDCSTLDEKMEKKNRAELGGGGLAHGIRHPGNSFKHGSEGAPGGKQDLKKDF